jgi:uncharacterized membrane protein
MSLFSIPKVFAQTPEELVGSIDVPEGVDKLNTQAGGIGIVLFVSNVITFIMIIGGIWTIFNIAYAAFTYITGGGKAESHQKARDSFSMSVIGLLLMIFSYSIAALIGLVFYGDPSFIISPTIDVIGQ